MSVEPAVQADVEAYQQALALLERCLTPVGFVASPVDIDNYSRVWARDGVITGLAGLASGEARFIKGMEHTLKTIASYQGKHGEIPSNVTTDGKHVSYGRLTGRVDAVLWFVIGVCAYVNHTRRNSDKELYWGSVERALYLVECWEYNDRGFLYTPISGNWADEYVQQGYVLADLILYEIALRAAGRIYHNKDWQKEADILREMLRVNFWPRQELVENTHVYHTQAYRNQLQRHGETPHWLAAFSASGYVSYFDGLAHALALLIDLGDEGQKHTAEAYVEQVAQEIGSALLPAFWPVIQPGDPMWEMLEANHLYDQVKNQPYTYHNGGLWPMVTGVYALGLVHQKKHEQAARLLRVMNEANAKGRDGRQWDFSEYHNGKTFEPMGTYHQAWSAAATILVHQAIWKGVTPWPLNP